MESTGALVADCGGADHRDSHTFGSGGRRSSFPPFLPSPTAFARDTLLSNAQQFDGLSASDSEGWQVSVSNCEYSLMQPSQTPSTNSPLKTWLIENEPYLRGLEVLAVVLIGGYISYLQLGISQKQAQVAEQSLKVSEAELKLIELQTDLQRMDHQPYFSFDHTGISGVCWPSHLYVRNKADGEVRALDATAKLFLVVESPKGTRRLLLDNFYSRPIAFPSAGMVTFSHSTDLIYPTFMGCQIEKYDEDYVIRHARIPERYPMPFTIYTFVELRYVAEDSRKVTQRFVMNFPDEVPTPVAEAPKYDATFDLLKYRTRENWFRYDEMFEDFRALLKEQSGGRLDLPQPAKFRSAIEDRLPPAPKAD